MRHGTQGHTHPTREDQEDARVEVRRAAAARQGGLERGELLRQVWASWGGLTRCWWVRLRRLSYCRCSWTLALCLLLAGGRSSQWCPLPSVCFG
jgi:hypothetical protein